MILFALLFPAFLASQIIAGILAIFLFVAVNVLTGGDRCRRVWSRVKSGEWHLTDQVLLEQRPEFVGPGDESARSDYVVVQLVHASISKCSKTRVDWWSFNGAG